MPLNLSIAPVLSVYLYVYIYIYLSLSLSLFLSLPLALPLAFSISLSLSFLHSLSLSLSVSLSRFASLPLSRPSLLSLYVYISISPYLDLPLSPSLSLSLYIYIYVCIYLYLSISLSLSLSLSLLSLLLQHTCASLLCCQDMLIAIASNRRSVVPFGSMGSIQKLSLELAQTRNAPNTTIQWKKIHFALPPNLLQKPCANKHNVIFKERKGGKGSKRGGGSNFAYRPTPLDRGHEKMLNFGLARLQAGPL